MAAILIIGIPYILILATAIGVGIYYLVKYFKKNKK